MEPQTPLETQEQQVDRMVADYRRDQNEASRRFFSLILRGDDQKPITKEELREFALAKIAWGQRQNAVNVHPLSEEVYNKIDGAYIFSGFRKWQRSKGSTIGDDDITEGQHLNNTLGFGLPEARGKVDDRAFAPFVREGKHSLEMVAHLEREQSEGRAKDKLLGLGNDPKYWQQRASGASKAMEVIVAIASETRMSSPATSSQPFPAK